MNANKIFHIFVYIFAIIGLFFSVGYLAIRFGFTNNPGIISNDRFFTGHTTTQNSGWVPTGIFTTSWNNTPEWNSLKEAIQKDQPIINQVSKETGINSRLIVSMLIVEQLRLFNDDRESFKKFFEPLKILGSQSVFSWGVLGIKKDTAVEVEANLASTTSPYYLGSQFEHSLDFKTSNTESERFTRITDQHNHYYSYLYAALYIKQVETQWKRAGFPINNRPEILATLYNLGFIHSQPKANPEAGGSTIPLSDKTYSFGEIAYDFYYSDELVNEFPRD